MTALPMTTQVPENFRLACRRFKRAITTQQQNGSEATDLNSRHPVYSVPFAVANGQM